MKVSLSLAGVLLCSVAAAQNAPVAVAIDATANRHAISPLIYGVAFAAQSDLTALNAPLNRSGGNRTTTYSYAASASNTASDYYFESYPDPSATPGSGPDAFMAASVAVGAKSMLTVPLIGHVAKLGPNRAILPSFAVSRYGIQCSADPYDSNAGNGQKPDCTTDITDNDVLAAYVADSPAKEQPWIAHLLSAWGTAAKGGVSYYLMDNEPSIWFSTHRDAHPAGPHAVEYRNKVLAESALLRQDDPSARIVAPEEWGWEAYFYSGYDQQYAPEHSWTYPDHAGVQGGLDYIPWLLKEWKPKHAIDVLSVHFYPQGGEYGSDDSLNTQLLRNRSTRQLWDMTYVSESWIGQPVYLIPRLQGWISKYYTAGTPVAITEYNWGDEPNMNGATTQADIYGIFGQQGLNLATRWTVPASTTPTYKAMQMYRNYDGKNSTFGDTSVAATVPNPDSLSAFAAQRTADAALTVMVINKIAGSTPVTLSLAHAAAAGSAQRWQLTGPNNLVQLPALRWSAASLTDTVPGQSVTLYILPQ
jgi:hypothetical protein